MTFVVTSAHLEELRDVSDREMARRYGTHYGVWSRARVKHDIERFRPPTTVGGVPAPWVARPERRPSDKAKLGTVIQAMGNFYVAPDRHRDYSLAGEAASFLRRERFHVYNRKIMGEEGWQVGRSQLSEAEMIGKAKRLGFVQEGWMG